MVILRTIILLYINCLCPCSCFFYLFIVQTAGVWLGSECPEFHSLFPPQTLWLFLCLSQDWSCGLDGQLVVVSCHWPITVLHLGHHLDGVWYSHMGCSTMVPPLWLISSSTSPHSPVPGASHIQWEINGPTVTEATNFNIWLSVILISLLNKIHIDFYES